VNSDKSGKTDGSRTLTTAGTHSSQGSSSTDLGPAQDPSHLLAGNGWNKKRYHRPDEEVLEEIEEHDSRQGPVRQDITMGSSIGISGWATSKPAPAYYTARCPPVNDLHPPVVSTLPTSRSDREWMKAKPPSAAFMEGKKGITDLNRNKSGTSSRNGQSTTNLKPEGSNKTPQRPDEQPIERHITPPPAALIRDRTDTLISQSGSKSRGRKRKGRAPQRSLSPSSFSSADTSDDEAPQPVAIPKRKSTTRRVPRPHADRRRRTDPISDSSADDALSPTATPSMASPALTARSDRDVATPALSPRLQPQATAPQPLSPRLKATRKASVRASPRPDPAAADAVVLADASLAVLQDLVDSRRLLDARFAARSPGLEALVRLPRADSREALALAAGGAAAGGASARDVEELWLDEKDVQSWGQDRRWSMGF